MPDETKPESPSPELRSPEEASAGGKKAKDLLEEWKRRSHAAGGSQAGAGGVSAGQPFAPPYGYGVPNWPYLPPPWPYPYGAPIGPYPPPPGMMSPLSGLPGPGMMSQHPFQWVPGHMTPQPLEPAPGKRQPTPAQPPTDAGGVGTSTTQSLLRSIGNLIYLGVEAVNMGLTEGMQLMRGVEAMGEREREPWGHGVPYPYAGPPGYGPCGCGSYTRCDCCGGPCDHGCECHPGVSNCG